MCAYKMAPFQTRTLPLLLEHVRGYPSITSVLKEDCLCSKNSWMDVHGAVTLNAVKLRNLVCSSAVKKFKRNYFDLIMCKFKPESLRIDRTHPSRVRTHVQYNQ